MSSTENLKIMSGWNKYIFLIIVFLLGLGPILSPYLNGIGEVCCPDVWRTQWFIWLSLWTLLGLISIIIYGAIAFLTLLRTRFSKYQLTGFLPLGLLMTLWIISNVSGLNYFDKWRDGYPIGGFIRLQNAGGLDKVQNEAIQLLNTETDLNPSFESLPDTLKDLYPYNVEINQETRTVAIYITSGGVFGSIAEFCYIIQEKASHEPPGSICTSENGEVPNWKLADGLYFDQTR